MVLSALLWANACIASTRWSRRMRLDRSRWTSQAMNVEPAAIWNTRELMNGLDGSEMRAWPTRLLVGVLKKSWRVDLEILRDS